MGGRSKSTGLPLNCPPPSNPKPHLLRCSWLFPNRTDRPGHFRARNCYPNYVGRRPVVRSTSSTQVSASTGRTPRRIPSLRSLLLNLLRSGGSCRLREPSLHSSNPCCQVCSSQCLESRT